MIDSGADVNIVISIEYPNRRIEETSLSLAAARNQLEVAKLLLSLGDNLNQKPNGVGIPWLVVCLRVNLAAVELFLEFGADPKAPFPIVDGKFEYSPLQAAVDGDGRETMNNVKLLLQAGADINTRVGRGVSTALHTSMLHLPHPALVKNLLDAGAELDPKDDSNGVYQLALEQCEKHVERIYYQVKGWPEVFQLLDIYYAKRSTLEISEPTLETPELPEIRLSDPTKAKRDDAAVT